MKSPHTHTHTHTPQLLDHPDEHPSPPSTKIKIKAPNPREITVELACAPEELLRIWLQMGISAWGDSRPKLAYRGPADFVLQHGRIYSNWIASPVRQLPRLCYANSVILAATRGLKYVEGYALSSQCIAIPHAWNSNDAGDIIDSTWPAPGWCYLGVEFSVERADDCTWNGDASVLDDRLRGFPILRQRWEGEPAGLIWPKSTRLEVARTGNLELLEQLEKEAGVSL